MNITEKQKKSYGVMVVVSAWLAVFCLFGYRSSFSIMQQSMIADLGWKTTQTSLGYCIMMAIYAITAFFSGSMVDKKGSRPAYIVGAICCFLGFFVTASVNLTTPAGFVIYCFTYGLFAGVGTGMLWVSSTVSCRKWYVGATYGGAWGWAFMGAPMAQLLLTLVLKPVLVKMGWQSGMKVLAFIMAVMLVIAAIIAKKTPAHYNTEPFGVETVKAISTRHWSVGEAFSKYPIYATIGALLFCVMAEFLVWAQVVSFFQTDMGLSLNKASNIYMLIGVFGIFTMPLTGKLSDYLVKRIGYEPKARRIMLLIAPASGVIGVILLLTKSVPLCVIATVFFAIYWAIEPGGCAGYAGALYGNNGFGKIWGLCTLIAMGIGPAVGTYMGAFFKEHFGTFKVALLFALCSYIISFVFALSMPLKLKGEKSEQ